MVTKPILRRFCILECTVLDSQQPTVGVHIQSYIIHIANNLLANYVSTMNAILKSCVLNNNFRMFYSCSFSGSGGAPRAESAKFSCVYGIVEDYCYSSTLKPNGISSLTPYICVLNVTLLTSTVHNCVG